MLATSVIDYASLIVAAAALAVALGVALLGRRDRKAEIEDEFMSSYLDALGSVVSALAELVSGARAVTTNGSWQGDGEPPYEWKRDPDEVRLPRLRLFAAMYSLPTWTAEFRPEIFGFVATEGPDYIAREGEKALIKCSLRVRDASLFDLRRRMELRGRTFPRNPTAALFDQYFEQSLDAAKKLQIPPSLI